MILNIKCFIEVKIWLEPKHFLEDRELIFGIDNYKFTVASKARVMLNKTSLDN
jgi:hypothetical protein